MTRRIPAIALAFTLLAFQIATAGSAAAAEQAAPPNIILIVADDLGYGDLSCFGQAKLRTPRLDKMAAEGMKLTSFYSGATVCAPSRSVLLTGQHTGRTVVRGNSTKPIVIEPGDPTVASLLKSAGYATGCIGKWGVGTPGNLTNPNDVGFDYFFGYVDMWHAHNFYPEFLIRNGEVVKLRNVVAEEWKQWQDPTKPKGGLGVAVEKVEYAPDLFADEAIKFIRDHRDGPFFLYYAMNVPHTNNEAGLEGMEVPDYGEFATRDWPEAEKGFASMIRNLDRDTGRVLELLDELGIGKNTLVVFTSDNGPHQESGHQVSFFDSNGPLTGIKRDATEGGIRVPTIAWWPGTVKPGTESDHPAYFGDVMATACELAEVDLPKERNSISFVPTLTGMSDQQKEHEYLYWEFYEQGSHQAVRFGDFKAIRRPMLTGDVQVYDLSSDLAESKNLASQRPDLVERAIRYMDEAHTPDPNWPAPRSKKSGNVRFPKQE